MARSRKVALLIETSNAYARGLLHGIDVYVREHEPWFFYLAEHSRGDRAPSWLPTWDGHGVIARVENKAIAQTLARMKIPVVDVSAAVLLPTLPFVETHDVEVARLAADHFFGRGFRKFAYCGDPRFNWSENRSTHFAAIVREAGYPCFVYQPQTRGVGRGDNQVDEIAEWISKLPKPLAVMACYDLRGQQVLEACRRIGIAVPDEVAVIGVDDDELICQLSSPRLSSVTPNARRTGYQAAFLLDQMMSGGEVRPGAHLIEPLGVTTRQSTDVFAIEDRQIADAARFIRENSCKGIGVEDVLKAVPMSRRLFENRFKKLLGRTPHEEIVRVQINRVKQLLTETDLPLSEIAARTGFEHVEYLSVAFKKKVGMPPSRFRTEKR